MFSLFSKRAHSGLLIFQQSSIAMILSQTRVVLEVDVCKEVLLNQGVCKVGLSRLYIDVVGVGYHNQRDEE